MKHTPKNKTNSAKTAPTLYESTPASAQEGAPTPEAAPAPEAVSVPVSTSTDKGAIAASSDFDKWASVPTMERMVEELKGALEFWTENGLSIQEAFDRVHEGNYGSARDIAERQTISSVGWTEMRLMEKAEPGSSEKMREVLLRCARADIKDGRLGARAVAHGRLTPMDEARYLAMVEEMSEGWEPRNGIERTLIEQMTQAHMQYMTWQERLNKISSGMEWEESKRPSATNKEPWLARVTQTEAVNQAVMMVDRFQRMFLRTQRALRDLRRHSITIDRVDQLNVGDQQVNIKEAGRQN